MRVGPPTKPWLKKIAAEKRLFYDSGTDYLFLIGVALEGDGTLCETVLGAKAASPFALLPTRVA